MYIFVDQNSILFAYMKVKKHDTWHKYENKHI